MDLQPGQYVIAVSGGVDSMALLHMLSSHPGVRLTVAHYDHGARVDSAEDRLLVQAMARELGLPFVYDEGRLGAGVSEAKARDARYEFLRRVQRATNARAVITAHHQDDVLETAVLNLVRGTGRRGLSSLGDSPQLLRPLLRHPKSALRQYAEDQGLRWREDSTNTDTTYLRNHIRHNVVPRLPEAARHELHDHIENIRRVNQELDGALINLLHMQPTAGVLERRQFIGLPHDVAKELMMCWLREQGLRQYDRPTIERLVVGAKTLKPGKRLPIYAGGWLVIRPEHLALEILER